MHSSSGVRSTSDGATTLRQPPLPARVYRPRSRTALVVPAFTSTSQPTTAFLRSPVGDFAEDEGLRQLYTAKPVNPAELSQLLQDHLDSENSSTITRADYDTEMASNNAFPPLDTSVGGGGRNLASPTPSHTGGAVNGNGVGASANYMATLPVGHQQDLNYLYAQIQELGGILRSNRDKVNVVTRTAEEVAKRANGALNDGESVQENDKARVRRLEQDLAKANRLIDLYKHEQKENTGLIAMYEDGMGTATEQIRNYCGDMEGRFLTQRRHYNNLLQQEKDEHLQSRLDRDHWHAQTLKVCEMIRTAHRLRTDEWCEEYRVISGLQAEVRCYRRILGMEPEKPEDETGWPYLKDLPLNDQA